MENALVSAQLEHFCCQTQRVVHPVIHPANHAQDPMQISVQDVVLHLLWRTQDVCHLVLQTTTLTGKSTVASHVTTTVQLAKEVGFIRFPGYTTDKI